MIAPTMNKPVDQSQFQTVEVTMKKHEPIKSNLTRYWEVGE